MNRLDRPDSRVGDPAQDHRSLDETRDRANRVIAQSRAEIARSKALGQSVADLNREIERARVAENNAPHAPKDGA